ncbi:MAG: hypothetical protein Q8R57_03855, partial [Bacteroidota bacterium]|nr:hypothetical protein [Bacteroidota bacterium]
MKYFIQNCNLLFFIFFIVLLNSCNGNRNNKFEPSNVKTIAQRIDSFVTKKINISAYKGSSKL